MSELAKKRAHIEATATRITKAVLEIPPLKPEGRKDWLAPPPLSEFQHLEPWGWGLDQEHDWVFLDTTPDVLWPVDTGIICEKGGPEGTLKINRFRSVTTKQVRGYASRFSPYMLRVDHAAFDRGRLLTAAGIEAWLGGKWVQAQRRVLWEHAGKGQIPSQSGDTIANDGHNDHMLTILGLGVALKQRYEWAVSVGLEKTLSVRFSTDPTGIKAIFKIRDLPPGADRREALLTWVSSHWRQDRHDPELEIYVRKHLRGAVSFTWRGLCAHVLPAPFDVEQRDKLIARRKQMRAEGADRRLAER